MGGIEGAAITGAEGFLGAHLVRGFEARGARVLPLVRVVDGRSPSGASALGRALDDPSLLSGMDVVVHAAGVRPRHGVDAATYRASNVDLMEHALRAASRARVRRFVLISSVGVYGFPSRVPITEEHPYAPRTRYAATRVEAEIRGRRLARELGIELVIARPTIVYGPGDRDGILDRMAQGIRARTYRIVGTGENLLHHTHVDDVVEGVWLAATHPQARDDHFILAGPQTTTLAELSELVAAAVRLPLPRGRLPGGLARAVATLVDLAAFRGIAFTSHEPLINHEKLDVLTLPAWFDLTKARTRLGFRPRVGYEEGVLRTVQGAWPALARAGAGE